MNDLTRKSGDYGFVMGLFAGTIVGAGLMMWLVPKATSELRDRVTDSASALRDRATDKYRQAGVGVGHVINEAARTGQGIRDEMAEAVVRGAQTVERFAVAAKTGTREL